MRTRRRGGVKDDVGERVIEINDSPNVDILQRLPRRRQQTVRYIESLDAYSHAPAEEEDPNSSHDETASPLYQRHSSARRTSSPPSADEDEDDQVDGEVDDQGSSDNDPDTAEDESEAPSPDVKLERPESARQGHASSRRNVRSAAEPTQDEIRYTLRDRSRHGPQRRSFDDPPKSNQPSSFESRAAAQVMDRATRYALRTGQRDMPTTTTSPKQNDKNGFHRSTKSYSLRDRSTLRRHVASNTNLFDDFGDVAPPPKRVKHHDRAPSKQTYALSSSSSSSSASSSDGEMQQIKRTSKKHSRRSAKKARHEYSDKKNAKKGAPPADISPLDIDPSITWDSIGGLKSHIHALQEMVLLPLLYPEFYAKFALTPPSGVLFYGPPGTGKTLVARALANSTGNQRITFYMRKGADCLSKWVGEAERQLRVLFEQAKKTEPSIIFFDEIDGLAPVRSAKQDQIHASIVSTLLALMDGTSATTL
ncbi:hypothetical protein B5M09_008922 [Aphanomyces astaci]|uniref:AAA+ ATPase domain-containing protein n=1 Tax=Aphanomyces astaci TaxID=112090 RepID=A0A425CZE4_APHAT|nr:hypothetical protein B5M09_008922 [Aphanomyces astaci]